MFVSELRITAIRHASERFASTKAIKGVMAYHSQHQFSQRSTWERIRMSRSLGCTRFCGAVYHGEEELETKSLLS